MEFPRNFHGKSRLPLSVFSGFFRGLSVKLIPAVDPIGTILGLFQKPQFQHRVYQRLGAFTPAHDVRDLLGGETADVAVLDVQQLSPSPQAAQFAHGGIHIQLQPFCQIQDLGVGMYAAPGRKPLFTAACHPSPPP